MALNERECFTEKPEPRTTRYQCPRCNRTNEYQVRWMRRTRKTQPPRGGDERDRALFAKLRDHLVRMDDDVTCKTCGKKFEIPSHQALMFVDQLDGLPKEDLEDIEAARAADQAPATPSAASGPDAEPPSPLMPDGRPLPKRFQRPSTGWK